MQWLIVSVIVVTCGVFALRACVHHMRRWFGRDSEIESGSPCNGCGGCGRSEGDRKIPVVQIGPKVRT